MAETTRRSHAPHDKEAEEEAPKAEETKTEESEKFIAFKAHNGVRIISKEEWAAIEIKQESAVWDKTNAWRIPSSEFTAKARNYLLNVDGEFAEEE